MTKSYPVIKFAAPSVDFFFGMKIIPLEEVHKIKSAIIKMLQELKSIKITHIAKFLSIVFIPEAKQHLEKIKDNEVEVEKLLYLFYQAITSYYRDLTISELLLQHNKEEFKKFPDLDFPKLVIEDFDLIYQEDNKSFSQDLAMSEAKKKDRKIHTKQDIEDLEQYLKDNIIGQNEAIESLVKGLKLLCTSYTNRLAYFFLGSTGVGKTQVSKLFGEKYSGRVFKIDCGELAYGHELHKLLGAPPGYVGHTGTNLLKKKADESNCWVIIFDEIEKAHPKVFDFLLGWLDNGYVTDNTGCLLDFSQSILVFTSNVGVRGLKVGAGKTVGFGENAVTYENSKDSIIKVFEETFSPEFRNRLDFVVFFNQLSDKDIKLIAELELHKEVPVDISNELLNFIIKGSSTNVYGAREIQRFIRQNISLKVADVQLDNLVPKNGKKFYSVQIVNDEVQIIDTEPFKPQRKSIKQKKVEQVTEATEEAPPSDILDADQKLEEYKKAFELMVKPQTKRSPKK